MGLLRAALPERRGQRRGRREARVIRVGGQHLYVARPRPHPRAACGIRWGAGITVRRPELFTAEDAKSAEKDQTWKAASVPRKIGGRSSVHSGSQPCV